MTAVSPWFFVHDGGGRNEVLDFDNWLYSERWEMLHDMRDVVDAVEIVTWNDYGESHYIGPLDLNDMPQGTTWVTSDFDHTAWLEMTGYYASYYKTGNLPSITADKIFMWGRTHSSSAVASNDPLPAPTNANWVEDYLFIVLFATDDGQLTVTQGSTTWSQSITAGSNKLNHTLAYTNNVQAVLTRNGDTVFDFSAPLYYESDPTLYNFNAIVAAGP